MNSNWSYSLETLNSAIYFVPCDLEIWQMTLKNNRAHFLCCFKLCASFRGHRWIQTGITLQKRSIRVKIGDFLSQVTLKFDGWPWKIIGHLFYAISSSVHHFKAIGEFKLELQSGNSQNRRFIVPCDLEIWRMTLKNNRTPLLCCFKLFMHQFIAISELKLNLQPGNAQFRSKSAIFSRVTLQFDRWPWKTKGQLS